MHIIYLHMLPILLTMYVNNVQQDMKHISRKNLAPYKNVVQLLKID